MNSVDLVLWFGPLILAVGGGLVVLWAKRH